MSEYITHSRAETVALGKRMAAVLAPGALIAFTGGFYDYLDQGAVVAAEWSENFADLLALENPIRVNIERLDDTTRRITIEGVTV